MDIGKIIDFVVDFFLSLTPLELAFMIAFTIWSFPLGIYRSRFRKLVYKTDDWKINIKPVFVKELKLLLGLGSGWTKKEIQAAKSYRLYLIVFILLFVVWHAILLVKGLGY